MKKAISLTTTAGESLTILTTDIRVVEAFGANYKIVYKDSKNDVKAAIVTDSLDDIKNQAECLFEVDGVYLSVHHTEFVAGKASGTVIGYSPNKIFTTSDSKANVVDRINQVGSRAEKFIVANRKTTSYTLVIGDVGELIEMNLAGANNLTVPPNADVAFPTGTQILVSQYGAGQTTIVAGSGVTIRSKDSALNLSGQYSAVTLVKIAENEWYAFGDLTA